ncbi:tyrosine kinase receptor Cad96Ca-like [Ptychodera flava]|uniref:tyrosine kinase receptor Cad96Ca-like n=1 Tax=Ptychodera flava TaxID=63121 RepID=UPI003969C20C
MFFPSARPSTLRKQGSSNGIIAGSTTALLSVIVVVAIVIILLRKGKINKKADKETEVELDDVKEENGQESKHERDILKETMLMKKIPRHRNVVRLLGVCTESARTVMILEYLIHGSLGFTLEDVRSKVTLSKKFQVVTEKQLLTFALDITEGMKHLEE